MAKGLVGKVANARMMPAVRSRRSSIGPSPIVPRAPQTIEKAPSRADLTALSQPAVRENQRHHRLDDGHGAWADIQLGVFGD